MNRIAASFIVLLALAVPAFAQNTFGEKIDVNVVLIDAIVTDDKGNQILGLDKNDFIVRENGVPQTIESVDYFTNRRLLDAPEGQAPFNVERVREERYFLFFFDESADNSFNDEMRLAVQAANDFIDQEMLDVDRVAIVGHDVRLKVYSDFTGDKGQLKRALQEVTKFSNGITEPRASSGPSILRNVDKKKMMDHTGTTYQALTLLADSLRPLRARKNLVLFSPGIHEPSETVRAGVLLNTSRYYEPMVRALNAANVAVYAINIVRDAPSTPALHQTLERVATATSGDYFRWGGNFTPALKRIENVNNGYYLISYRTKKSGGESGFQKVDVKLRNPEFRVKAREGYAYGG